MHQAEGSVESGPGGGYCDRESATTECDTSTSLADDPCLVDDPGPVDDPGLVVDDPGLVGDTELVEITCDLRQSGRERMSDEDDEAGEISAATWGGVIEPFALHNAAMPFHYFLMGYISGVVNGLLYGILVGTMALDAKQYVTSQAVIIAPWSIKCCVGFLSDNFPLLRHRRRCYCIFGNILTCTVFVGLCIFYEKPMREYCEAPDEQCMHFDPKDLHIIIVCFALICTGLVLSDSACDGLMISVSKTQITRTKRSCVPIGCFVIRVVGTTLAYAILIFGFDGETLSGFFVSGMPLWIVFASCACLGFVGIVLWCFMAKYDTEGPDLRCVGCLAFEARTTRPADDSYCSLSGVRAYELFRFACNERFCYFILYNLLAPIVVNVTSPTVGLMGMYWTPTDAKQMTFLVSTVAIILSLLALMTWFLKCNWSYIIVAVTTLTVCVSLPITVFAALDVCRNQYLFMLQDVLRPLPAASMYLVATLATVELVPPGHEATIYGLVSTSHILAISSAGALSNVVYGYLADVFDLSGKSPFFQKQNYLDDTDEFRLAIVASACIQCSLMLLSQTLVVLMPASAKDARAVKERLEIGAEHGRYGMLTFSAILICFLVAVTLNVMTVVPNLRCMQYVNGIGCDP